MAGRPVLQDDVPTADRLTPGPSGRGASPATGPRGRRRPSIEPGACMNLIDLSQDIYEGMKVYPGHLKTVQFEHATHEETAPRFEGGFSFQTTGFMLNDNGPTHVDSFSHLDPDPAADTIEKMPLDLFYGTAICLALREFKPRPDIPAEGLDRVVAAAPVDVEAGDIVLFPTATWNRYSGDKRYLSEFPGLGASASEWIV